MKVARQFEASNHKEQTFENRLRAKRIDSGFSQGALAKIVGLTRQAIYAMETNQYLPSTEVSLRLAKVLNCTVEDLFRLDSNKEVLQAELIGPTLTNLSINLRVKMARVGNRLVVRPVASLGDWLNYTVPADGLILGPTLGEKPRERRSSSRGRSFRVQLLRECRAIEEEIVVAGCDPAIFLAGEHFRRHRGTATVVGWTMGSAAAVEALKRREVHVAGLHIVDQQSGESNLPYLRRHLKGGGFTVVRFAAWEQGLMVRQGNPKRIRGVADLIRRNVRMVNREKGAGARLLLDGQLAAEQIAAQHVRGYEEVAFSHLEVGRLIVEGKGDVGVGVRSAAMLFNLDFLPLQEERYDLVFPTAYLRSHPSMSGLLNTIVSRSFRTEIEALGGYDTREIGKVIDWQKSASCLSRRSH